MSGEEPPPANPTLDLNKVEAKEASEHMTSSGIQVAGGARWVRWSRRRQADACRCTRNSSLFPASLS